jgi:hypothetical protein
MFGLPIAEGLAAARDAEGMAALVALAAADEAVCVGLVVGVAGCVDGVGAVALEQAASNPTTKREHFFPRRSRDPVTILSSSRRRPDAATAAVTSTCGS